jgi:glycogen debranching enzyme
MTATGRVTVHQGTFLATGPAGDIAGTGGTSPDGLFLRDARHLSRWQLSAGGGRLTVLTADDDSVVLVPPGTRDEPAAFTVLREQAVAQGAFTERVTLVNNLPETVEAVLEVTVDADFADQFELRSDHRHYAKGGARRDAVDHPDGVEFRYRRGDDWTSRTRITTQPAPDRIRPVSPSSVRPAPDTERPDCTGPGQPGGANPGAGGPETGGAAMAEATAASSATGRVLTWCFAVPGQAGRELVLAVEAFAGHGPAPAEVAGTAGITGPAVLRAERARDITRFTDAEPRPDTLTDWPELAQAVRHGMADLAGLRVPATGPDGEPLRVPGAGTPWFLTLFGRDALLTSLFCLPYRPATAAATLMGLARAQGTGYDATRLEEPGRIPHEIRHGELAHFRQVPYGRYYGSVDATPLFLVLLHAYTEATGDAALALRLEPQARAAVEWMFRDGGIDRHGWLVYTSDEAAGGLANLNWKDSAGAICFADGTQATGAIAVAEAQGYAYDALRRTARLAADVWSDPHLARRLDDAARELRRRFPQEFWLAEADFPALALDGERRQVDALASDAGHLLWSGILDQPRAERVGRRLLAPDFFSGWGIRTLAAGQAPYHPLSYHRGSIWPHDNAIIALGLARHGLAGEARTVATALVDAARHHGWRLPEVMSGLPRDLHPAPVPYPHSCSPQAWAAATPLALLTATAIPTSSATPASPGGPPPGSRPPG